MLLTITNLRKAYFDTPVITVPSLTLEPGTHFSGNQWIG